MKGTAEVVDTSQLGSTIMETMLKEVRDFCNPVKRNNWSDSTRQQVCSKCASIGNTQTFRGCHRHPLRMLVGYVKFCLHKANNNIKV